MGNAGSNLPRERHKSGSHDAILGSPLKDGQAFVFDKKPDPNHRLVFQRSEEDGEPYYSKSVPEPEFLREHRQRSNTVSNDSALQSDDDGKEPERAALPTVFKWEGGGKQVYISGTFSEWKALPMVKSHGDFVTIIDLPEGDHQYKFCVDGEWKHDPRLKNIENDVGTKNNLVSVRQSDFEVFQALAKDSEDTGNNETKEYGQDIPTSKPWGKESGPPVLPPHLLQVILNKDTPLSCEPTLLPEPNHVMLNHLYALSIKDGVMVLSATHRYRKKYVTTLLYKPI
ncbi:5'-AMP-activated protein kinase subunit beta-1 [Toxorhynchites rutilus septentrionalis]|uniref:5'-AMP-activated protein kinase subunit beta-1 n=1 Tax=Toxorhynchites rutilus septentrionalis TaxID=329112 RepID=UPI002479F289|nr:5'-AMP-activated protein kinase subunit beta-1 [Toxorhynchites rutilus septentrionalis]